MSPWGIPAASALPELPESTAMPQAATAWLAARWQSSLAPAGRQAERIDDLWWLLFWVSVAVFALVMLATLAAVLAGRRRRIRGAAREGGNPGSRGEELVAAGEPAGDLVAAGEPARDLIAAGEPAGLGFERRAHRAVAVAVAVTVLILVGLLVASVGTGRAIADLSGASGLATGATPRIRITGFQWWWQVEYQDPVPALSFDTANEIHLPVGQPVLLELASHDVIHSFWVPSLHGKMDLIPGRLNHLWIQADRPGVYRGQCAEFCGLQHAHMALVVVAEPPAAFAAWRERQLRPAGPPADPLQAHGQAVFMTGPCVLCHAVRGTDAGGRNGPDLTHVASRRTLAAATLTNRRGQLEGWILDPQHAKPGNRMPPNTMSARDLHALATYLEGLR